jgi:hypothetical protein
VKNAINAVTVSGIQEKSSWYRCISGVRSMTLATQASARKRILVVDDGTSLETLRGQRTRQNLREGIGAVGETRRC